MTLSIFACVLHFYSITLAAVLNILNCRGQGTDMEGARPVRQLQQVNDGGLEQNDSCGSGKNSWDSGYILRLELLD